MPSALEKLELKASLKAQMALLLFSQPFRELGTPLRCGESRNPSLPCAGAARAGIPPAAFERTGSLLAPGSQGSAAEPIPPAKGAHRAGGAPGGVPGGAPTWLHLYASGGAALTPFVCAVTFPSLWHFQEPQSPQRLVNEM